MFGLWGGFFYCRNGKVLYICKFSGDNNVDVCTLLAILNKKLNTGII